MTKLEKLIEELCPNGVEYVKLVEVCDDIIVPMRDRPKIFDGDIPWCRIEDIEGQFFNRSLSGLCVSEQVIKKMNLKVFPTGTVICSCSASLGAYAINTQPLITNQTFIGLVCGAELYNKYLLYYMETQTRYLKSQASTGTIPYISRKKFEELCIPLPPLEVQAEIVRILDNFTELTTELTTELAARKQQYEYYRDNLLRFEQGKTPVIELGESCDLQAGKFISASEISSVQDDKNCYPCYGANGLRGYVPIYNQNGSFPLIGRQGALCGNVCYAKGKFYATEHAVVVSQKGNYDARFLYYLLVAGNLNQYKTAGAQPGLSVARLEKVKFPIPPLEIQKRIAHVLDNFDAICTDLNIGLPAEIEARQKQYEYYRDKLLTFTEKQ